MFTQSVPLHITEQRVESGQEINMMEEEVLMKEW